MGPLGWVDATKQNVMFTQPCANIDMFDSRLPPPLLLADIPGGDGVSGGAGVGLQGGAHPHGLQEGHEGRGGRPPKPDSSQGRNHRRRPSQADQGERVHCDTRVHWGFWDKFPTL